MPVFSSIAAAVTAVFTAIGASAFVASVAGTIAAFAARTMLTMGVSRLLTRRGRITGTANIAAGVSGSRTQLPPSTDNKLPVIYGKAFISPVITDAKISDDQKIMWYVCSLAEVTEGAGVYSFGDIYWGGKKVIFDNNYTSRVIALETNSDPVQTDIGINGLAYIWRFPDGSLSGIDTGGSSAIQLLSDSLSGGGIPANLRWDSPLYNSNGQSPTMDRVAFLVIKLEYNIDAGTTGLPPITVELTNSITRPGQAIYDYMVSERYGCGIKPNDIDTLSLVALDNYSDQQIQFIDTNNTLQTQPRYRINGPIDTNNKTLDNLEMLVDSVDSWLQYSELTGKWKVVINRSIEQSGQTISGLYQINDSNLIGGINLNPIDLNSTFNQLQVQYPNKNIRDQTDFQTIKLIDYYPQLLSKNEPINQLIVQYPVVNNYIQSVYLGLRKLIQSREDLVIDCLLDYSGIQIEAGDVITVNFQPYGWNTMNSGFGKLFRVSQVQEAKLDDGSLGAQITAFEYNSTVYIDNILTDFVPADNTGLQDPNIIGQPVPPTIRLINVGSVDSMEITGIVPTGGSTLYMDFNYGNNSNTDTHVRYTSVSSASGIPFLFNSNVTISCSDLPSGNIFWSITARNDFSGTISNSSNVFQWKGVDINIPVPTIDIATNAFSSGNTITCSSVPNIVIGANVFVTNGTGLLSNTTSVTQVISNGTPTIFTVAPNPITPLSNATIEIITGGIPGSTIRPNTLTVANTEIVGNIVASQISNIYSNIVIGQLTNEQLANIANTKILGNIIANQISNVANTSIIGQLTNSQLANIDATKLIGTIVANQISNGAITSNKLAANSVVAGTIAAGAVQAGALAANSVVAGTIAAGAVQAGALAANSVLAQNIAANSVVAGTIAAGAVQAGALAASSVVAGTIAAGAVQAGQLAANSVLAQNLAANSVGANQIAANSIIAVKIQAGAIETDKLATNSVTSDKIVTNSITSDKIAANSVTSNKISVASLSAISANMGTVTAGTFQTNTSGNRVEISSFGNFPIWAGTGTKNEANSKFYINTSGDAFFAGNLSAAGGTIDINTGATGSGNTAFNLLKGGRFITCRDGVPVTFNPAFPTGTNDRILVVFVNGGLTYSNSLTGSQFQQFNAFNVTNTGFLPSLKLGSISTGLSEITVNFNGQPAVLKTGVQEAYDIKYTVNFDIGVSRIDEFDPISPVVDVYLFALRPNQSWFAISNPITIGEGFYGNVNISGFLSPAPQNTFFALVYGVIIGNPVVNIIGNTLKYTVASSSGSQVTATPAGTPDVSALVYLV